MSGSVSFSFTHSRYDSINDTKSFPPPNLSDSDTFETKHPTSPDTVARAITTSAPVSVATAGAGGPGASVAAAASEHGKSLSARAVQWIRDGVEDLYNRFFLTPAKINALRPDQLKASHVRWINNHLPCHDEFSGLKAHVLNNLVEKEIFRGFNARALNSMSDEELDKLDVDVLNRMHVDELGKLKARVLNSMSNEELGKLEARVLRQMSDNELGKLKARVLNSMSDDALTPDFNDNLNDESLKILTKLYAIGMKFTSRVWDKISEGTRSELNDRVRAILFSDIEAIVKNLSDEQLQLISPDRLNKMPEKELEFFNERARKIILESISSRMNMEELNERVKRTLFREKG